MTLDQLALHIFRLYGERNSLYMPDLSQRLEFLTLGIRNLENALENKERASYQLASIFGRLCAIAENFPRLSLADALAEKYPFSGCCYCHKLPCGCDPSARRAPVFHPMDEGMREWSLQHFQIHLNRMYGEANKKRGIESALLRLFSEAAELMSLRLISTQQTNQRELFRQYGLELADVLARTLAIANLLDINLEAVVIELYGKGCRDCKSMVCKCGWFDTKLIKTYLPGTTLL